MEVEKRIKDDSPKFLIMIPRWKVDRFLFWGVHAFVLVSYIRLILFIVHKTMKSSKAYKISEGI